MIQLNLTIVSSSFCFVSFRIIVVLITFRLNTRLCTHAIWNEVTWTNKIIETGSRRVGKRALYSHAIKTDYIFHFCGFCCVAKTGVNWKCRTQIGQFIECYAVKQIRRIDNRKFVTSLLLLRFFGVCEKALGLCVIVVIPLFFWNEPTIHHARLCQNDGQFWK